MVYSETNDLTVMNVFEPRNGFSDELFLCQGVSPVVDSADERCELLEHNRGIARLHAPWTGKCRQTPVSLKCSTCSCRSDTGVFLEGEKQVDAAACSDRTLSTSGLPHVWRVGRTKRWTPLRFAGR